MSSIDWLDSLKDGIRLASSYNWDHANTDLTQFQGMHASGGFNNRRPTDVASLNFQTSILFSKKTCTDVFFITDPANSFPPMVQSFLCVSLSLSGMVLTRLIDQIGFVVILLGHVCCKPQDCYNSFLSPIVLV